MVLPISMLTDNGVIKIYCFLSEALAVSICKTHEHSVQT